MRFLTERSDTKSLENQILKKIDEGGLYYTKKISKVMHWGNSAVNLIFLASVFLFFFCIALFVRKRCDMQAMGKKCNCHQKKDEALMKNTKINRSYPSLNKRPFGRVTLHMCFFHKWAYTLIFNRRKNS